MKKTNTLIGDINFLYEIGSLRYVERTWKQFFQQNVANNADHMFRVAWIALTIARHEGVHNDEKILKMALLHDIAESRAPDTNYLSKIYSTRDEEKALTHMLQDTVFAKEFHELFHEYEERKTIESQIVKDADNLDVDFEIHEMTAKGHTLKKIWKRTAVREKLFTKTAQRMWDELQESNPNQWHLNAHNKYTAEKDRK